MGVYVSDSEARAAGDSADVDNFSDGLAEGGGSAELPGDGGSSEGGSTSRTPPRDESGRFKSTFADEESDIADLDSDPWAAAAEKLSGKPKPSDDASAAASDKGGDKAANGKPKASGATAGATTKQSDAGIAATDIDEDAIAQAAERGLSREDLSQFGSKAELDRFLVMMDRMATRSLKGGDNGQSTNASASSSGASETKAASGKLETPASDDGSKSGATGQDAKKGGYQKLSLDLSQFDEDTVKIVNGINDHYDNVVRSQAGEIEQLKGVVGEFQAYIRQQETERVIEQMEGFIDDLGPDFEDVFGKGSDLSPDSPHSKQRVEFFREVALLRKADQLAGRPTRTIRQYAERALRTFDGTYQKLISKERGKVATRVEQRRGMAVSRPTHRESRQLTPEERAIARIRDAYKEHGLDFGDEEANPDV